MPEHLPPPAYIPDHVLIPVDGTPLARTAVDAALALAGTPGRITLLHVVNAFGLGGEGTLEAVASLADELRGRSPGTVVEPVVAHGDPVEEILATATATQPDLVVMATHEFLAPSVPASDTVSARVASITSIPVLVAHGDRPEWRPRRVVTPLDGSMRSVQVLPYAAGIAHHLGAPVHLVTVIDQTVALPPAYAYSCPECDSDLQDALSSLQCQANALLNDAEHRLRGAGLTVTSELLLGRTAPSLQGVLRDDDVLVMTTRGGGRHSSPHFGSIATRMLRESPVPVVVFHPRLATAITHNPLTMDWEATSGTHRTVTS